MFFLGSVLPMAQCGANKGIGRKISREWGNEKTRLKNSIIKPPVALSVSCIKILPPAADAHGLQN